MYQFDHIRRYYQFKLMNWGGFRSEYRAFAAMYHTYLDAGQF